MSEIENETSAADLVDAVVPTPEDFSLYDLLEAVEYPTDEVTVSLNERAAHQLARLDREIKEYLADGDEETGEVSDERLAEYREKLDNLRAQIDKSKVTFYLRGVPDDVVTGANDIVEAAFDDKKKNTKTADGRIVKVLPENQKLAYMRYLNAVIFSMHIERVYYHGNGATIHRPDPDQIAAFYDKAPAAAQSLLTAKIQALRVEATDYERNFDEGFFPKS